jgi:hypothetical protein
MIDDIFEGSLIVDSRNGIFCPQSFAERVDRNFFPQISEESWNILEDGPDHDEYWDVWVDDFEGQESVDGGTIYQDGDVWIVYKWDEE